VRFGLSPRGVAARIASEPVGERIVKIAGVDVDEAKLAAICRQYGVTELSAFGSAVRGTDRPTSDVDLLYVLAPDARIGWDIERLADELAALFGRPVDLVSRRHLHRLIRSEVEAEAQVLYAA
jgi:predicted nucleotidyltransferase